MLSRPWHQHYDYWVRPHLTYPGRPLTEILDSVAVDLPDHPATRFLGATLTFSELKQRADRFACALGRMGIVRGDHVAIMLPNCPQYIIAVFGVLRLGAVVVNVNPTYTARELMLIIRDAGPRVLVVLDALAPMATSVGSETGLEHIVVTSLAEYAAGGAPPPKIERLLSLTTLIEQPADRGLYWTTLSGDDLAVLQYTGGTTGLPKGAMLTHRNIFANVLQSEAFMHRSLERGGSRYLVVIPYFHIYAFSVGMMMGLWTGATQLLLPKYEVESVLLAIRDFRPTYFPAVPTIFVSLLSHPKVTEFGLEKVRIFNSGGAPCPVDVIERFERTIGRPLYEGYGLSESSPVTHTTPQLARRKPGTIGVAVSDTDVKIVDIETGRTLPAGETGELCISGPQVMRGYWNQPQETAETLRTDEAGQTWLHTGDIARMDEDGFVSIVQRKKDLILVDALNVYPSEIEGVLYAHPAVRLAAAIGVPDAYHGEVVRAYIALRPGASTTPEDVIAHCRTQLAPYKVPSQVEIRDALPMSAVGKVLYRVLREEVAQVDQARARS
jgi:long-chain acyl-CoA synthetase